MTIHHADFKSLDELMEGLRALITRVRAGRLHGSDLTDATITVTNLGDLPWKPSSDLAAPGGAGFGKITEQASREWHARGWAGADGRAGERPLEGTEGDEDESSAIPNKGLPC